jgi:hypothetical protein
VNFRVYKLTRRQVAASDCVTVWNTTNFGTTNDRQIKIPAIGNTPFITKATQTAHPTIPQYAERFNQPVGTWDVGNVTKLNSMFSEAPAFNQPLNDWTILFDTFDPSCTAFPVALVSFEAVRKESAGWLTWSTTEEVNSDRFEIRRSSDAKHWNLIGELPSATQSNVLKKYGFTENAPLSGPSYYRLRMVDRALDGKDAAFAYSGIQKLMRHRSCIPIRLRTRSQSEITGV